MQSIDLISPDLFEKFQAAVEHVNNNSYTNSQRAKFYGLYKQVTAGKCRDDIKKPPPFKIKAYRKYNAWKSKNHLSTGEAMQAYIKFLAKIDETFHPEDVRILSERLSRAVKSLEELPPIVPPAFHGRHFKSKKKINTFRFQEQRIVSGIDPENGVFDERERISLHARLIEYYKKFDKDRIKTGFGEVVDMGLTQGIAVLDMKLKDKFGTSLTAFEEERNAQQELMLMKLRTRINDRSDKLLMKTSSKNNKTNSAALPSYTRTEQEEVNSHKSNSQGPEEGLVADLESFFFIYDPEGLDQRLNENGFEDLVEYAETRGMDALNNRLFKKYGKNLHDMSASPTAKVSGAQMTSADSFYGSFRGGMTMDSENPGSRTRSKARVDPDSVSKWSRDVPSEPGSPIREDADEEFNEQEINLIELPNYVKKALKGYYTKFDPIRFSDGSVKKVWEWAQRNGLPKLNIELEKRYNQTLDDFVEERNQLRQDLIDFYTKIDQTKLVEGIEKILNWGIKNGRYALNDKLRKKYGVDLVTYSGDVADDNEFAVEV
eukprot:maker-scaffold_1-snap-gene-10.35-mRNA-1 protein AED:0.09 eAED:0.09 QI:153/1/1/1/1/1/3/300/544